MTSEGMHIQDVDTAERLIDTLRLTGKTMAEIDSRVSNYLRAVEDALERQLDFLRDRLDEAQEKLREAEQALSSCESSQVFVPELGEYVPSCSCEEAEVSAARDEVAEWERKYEEGQAIVADCRRETEEYNGYMGGHQLIQNMSDNQTAAAIEELSSKLIAKAQAILGTNVVTTLLNT